MAASVNYLKDMSKANESGDFDIMVAEHYLQKLEWDMALQYLEEGISKGSLSDSDKAFSLLEYCNDCLGLRRLAAKAYFRKL